VSVGIAFLALHASFNHFRSRKCSARQKPAEHRKQWCCNVPLAGLLQTSIVTP
jgi:hypothetical protein